MMKVLGIDRALAGRIGSLAIPVILAMLMQTGLNQVDHILVGHLPREEATPGQVALQLSLVILWLVGGFLSAISVGTQAMAARRFGAGDKLAAGKVLTNSFAVAAVTSIVAGVITSLTARHYFPLLIKDPAVLQLGIPYLEWRMFGVISMVTTASCKSWFDGIGRTRLHMYAAVVMNVVNFVLAYGLIFGRLGFPRMGVEGVGLASMVSSFVGLIVMAWFASGHDVRHDYGIFNLKNLDAGMMKELVKLGVPSGLATLFAMSGFGFFLWCVGQLDVRDGTGSLNTGAASNIIAVLQLTLMTCLAYGTATATLVSQNMGAKRFDLSERYAWQSVRLGAYVLGLIGLFAFAFPELILSGWTKDPAVIALATPTLRIVALAQPCIVAGIVLTQALFGAGNTLYVMVVELVLHFCFMVPGAYLLGVHLGYGLMGVFASAMMYVVLLMLVMGRKFRSGDWKHIQI